MNIEVNNSNGLIKKVTTKIKKEGFDRDNFAKIMTNLSKEFIDEQFYRGNELLEYAKEKNIEIGDSFIVLRHKQGVALVNIYSYVNENGIYVTAAINVEQSFNNGCIFSRGLSTLSIIEDNNSEYIEFTTQDILSKHNLYISWVIERLEKEILSNIHNTKEYNELDLCEYDKNLFNPLEYEVSEIINRNKSKRIDNLIIDGVTVKEYIVKNKYAKYINSENNIFKVCLKYGKTYDQVRKYIYKLFFR